MGRRVSLLSNPEESLAKKTTIEGILNQAKFTANANAATWLPFRRYLQKVLWSLSLAELKAWTLNDTTAIWDKLQGNDPRSKQIAQLEELVRAQALAISIYTKDKNIVDEVEKEIIRLRNLGR